MHPRIKDLIAGPIAVVPTAFTTDYEVDCGRMEAATEQWIDRGLVEGRSVLKVGASIGEGQLLREAEWARLLETVVEAARGRVPVIGAISAAAQIGIIVYVTNPLRHGSIMPETLARMADFEKVVAIKWAPPADVDHDAVFGLADHFLVARDGDETTVVTEERHVASVLFEEEVKWFRLIEIQVSLPFLAKGFIAAVTRALADRDLNVLVVSTFSKDYLLIREEGADEALAALRALGFPLAAD